ncbi:MAG: ribonuclease Z [Bacteroidales bacterium]|nr:ribonuclease Z [Bacteroidales bacterium]
MKLTILGSSSALPTSERYPSAHVLSVHERLYLIDCGEGTQMQFRRNKIRFSKLNHIFISHIHGDHVFGLYGLISTMNLMGRTLSLNLYAPAKYREILFSHLLDFDIVLGFNIDFIALDSNDPVKILDNRHLTVTSFPLRHRIPSYGFLFREKAGDRNIKKESIEKYNIPVARIPAIKKGEDFVLGNGEIIKNEEITVPGPAPLSYAYCSDTMYFKRLSSFVKNVDLLYHEATFEASLGELARITGHSTSTDAARSAFEAKAGTLIIGHFSSRHKDVKHLVEEARSIFPRTIAAIDGTTYDVGNIDVP